MSTKRLAKSGLKRLQRHIGWPISAQWARLMALGIRPPAFIGAYPNREHAISHVSSGTPASYDDDDIAPVNFEVMKQIHIWDYPVMFWLERLVEPNLHVLDAGGHFGTKYIAFHEHIDLDAVIWSTYDLPATIRAARNLQKSGIVPGEIRFFDDVTQIGAADVLLASGLLQYLDIEFAELIGKLTRKPKHILLNKVATTLGPTVVTLEKIGNGRIPYQIRNREAFEQGISEIGYTIRDSWQIPSLSRTIATHPALGASTSMGYFLERAE